MEAGTKRTQADSASNVGDDGEQQQQPTPEDDSNRALKRRKSVRTPRALLGLSTDNVITPPATCTPVNELIRTSAHVTRQARNGRSVPTANYDMKYHPVDKAIRPKRAAKRLGILPLELGVFIAGPDTDGSDRQSQDSRNGSASDSDGDSGEDVSANFAVQNPHPAAIRHSQRPAAQKVVIYNRNAHPQDYALPGHQKKGRELRRQVRRAERGTQAPSRSHADSEHEDDDDDGDEAEEVNEAHEREQISGSEDIDQIDQARPADHTDEAEVYISDSLSEGSLIQEGDAEDPDRLSRASPDEDEAPLHDLENAIGSHTGKESIDDHILHDMNATAKEVQDGMATSGGEDNGEENGGDGEDSENDDTNKLCKR